MRIAFFTEMFPPLINGVAVNTLDLAKSLADRGHLIYVFAPKHAGFSFNYPNIRLMPCRAISVPMPKAVPMYKLLKLAMPFNPWILKFVKKEKIDLIHLHTPTPLGMQAIILAKFLKLPLVGTFHGFFMDKSYLKHIKLDYDFVELLAWKYAEFMYNWCDLIVCSSEGSSVELKKRHWKPLVRVIPLGLDLKIVDNTQAHLVKEKYGKNNKLLLFVGRIAYEKNIPYLLECFFLALKRVRNAKLLIVGDGPQMPDVKEKIAELNIGESVILLGAIEHEKLMKSGIYEACDLFVHASTTETGPLTVLEAQANGLVCVAVKSKAMKLIQNNVNGYLVKPNNRQAFANAVVKLLMEKSVYLRMQKATRASIQKYDLSHIASLWEKTYEGVVRNKKA